MDQQNNTPQPNSTKPFKSKILSFGKKKIILIVLVLVLLVVSGILLWQIIRSQSPGNVESQLSQTTQASLGRIDGIEINFDARSGTASIEQTEQTEIPEISAQNIRTAYLLLVRLGEQMFSKSEIKNIKIIERVQLNFPSDPANEFLPREEQATRPPVITEAVTITMSKTNFQSIDWQNLRGQPVHEIIKRKSQEYIINPQIESQIDERELYLDL